MSRFYGTFMGLLLQPHSHVHKKPKAVAVRSSDMMKRTLSLSRALNEQTNEKQSKARIRKAIRLGSHDFPAGPVSPVDTFVGRFVIGDPSLLGNPFEPTGRVLHGDVAQQDGLGHGSGKIDRRKHA